MDYSVLMTVYYKEKPEYLKISIDSILNQTVPTNDFIIVCDGPLTDELDEVLNLYEEKENITVLRLAENVGQGIALNEGLKICKNELVARMDSDDISLPERCEEQLKVFEALKVDVVGSCVREFDCETGEFFATKTAPETHSQILSYAKRRNPMNHPSVMFKKSRVLNVEGYKHFYLYEDYYLWVRMLMDGSVFYNIQKPLVNMRSGYDMYMRRGGHTYYKSGKAFQKFMLDNKFITLPKYLFNLTVRFFVQSLMPNILRKQFYLKMLR